MVKVATVTCTRVEIAIENAKDMEECTVTRDSLWR